MKKKILAFLCAIAMVVSTFSANSTYVKEVKAAAGTMHIDTASFNHRMGYKSVANGGTGYLNLPYTGVASDYERNAESFLNMAFSDQYITYGGGMTATDLMDGVLSFYVATDSILQLNWAYRTAPFIEGWSFTIAKGAPIPYHSPSGTKYMPLDKEYTFTVLPGNGDYDCFFSIRGREATTFSLGQLSLWGNGQSGAAQIYFADSNVANYQSTYTYIHEDESYKDYIRITGVDFEEYVAESIKIRYVMAGSERCIQIEDWGTLRTKMGQGDQLIFYEGLPIYYVDVDGNEWKATLDATYVYECLGSNTENTQIFRGVNLADAQEYGLTTSASAKTTIPQSDTDPEQYHNINFDNASSGTISHNIYVSVLGDTIARDYVSVSGCTVDEAVEKGLVFRFIPGANVFQVGFSEVLVDTLEVGDTILLKKGMSVVYLYDGELCAAKLDSDYIFTITANNGTQLSLTYTVAGTYSLKGVAHSPVVEGGYKYWGLDIAADAFGDAASRGEGQYTFDKIQDYVELSGHTVNDALTDGSCVRWYTYEANVYQGIRLYSNLNFTVGEVLMVKKGLPIHYNTKAGKNKTATLNRDYGFVFDGNRFIYDASLGNEEKENSSGKKVFDFNGIDFDTSRLAGEGINALADACLAKPITDTSAVPAGFTGGVYGGGNGNYASVAVAFSAPIDLSKVKSVKVRMYVPEYSASASSQFRLLTNESTDVGVPFASGSYTELGGTFGKWSDVDITELLKSSNTVKDAEGYLGRFIIGYRTREAITCYFDSITISYKDKFLVEDDTSFKETTIGKIHSASSYKADEQRWYIYTIPTKPAAVPGTPWSTMFDAVYEIDGTRCEGVFVRANNTEGLALRIPGEQLPADADGVTVTIKAGEYAASDRSAGIHIVEDFTFYLIDGAVTVDYDFNNPAFTSGVYCDVDHDTYVIDDADTVTIDGETYSRGDTYAEVGVHTLTYVLHNHEYTRTLIFYHLGDLDDDSDVDLIDLMAGKKHLANVRDLSLTGEKALDMDNNGNVNFVDGNLLGRYLVTESGVLAVAPVDGTTTAFASEPAENLITDYYETKADLYRTGQDIYYRKPTVLKWFSFEDATQYTVEIWSKKDLSDKQTFTVNDCTVKVENLFAGTDYYWTVTVGDYVTPVQQFHTADTIRTLTIQGVSNTRDGGGWPTLDGKKIKQGMFYRGGKLEGITAEGLAAFRAVGVKTDLDLRNNTETSATTSPLGTDVNYVNYSGPYYWSDNGGAGINTEEYRAALVNEIRLFADKDNYPIYVHCSLGRDRTGTLCFLINALCGVGKQELCLDYEFSFLSVTGNADNQTAKNMMASFDYMYAKVKEYAPNGTMAEATEAFMLSIGVSQSEIDAIRTILIEE